MHPSGISSSHKSEGSLFHFRSWLQVIFQTNQSLCANINMGRGGWLRGNRGTGNIIFLYIEKIYTANHNIHGLYLIRNKSRFWGGGVHVSYFMCNLAQCQNSINVDGWQGDIPIITSINLLSRKSGPFKLSSHNCLGFANFPPSMAGYVSSDQHIDLRNIQ